MRGKGDKREKKGVRAGKRDPRLEYHKYQKTKIKRKRRKSGKGRRGSQPKGQSGHWPTLGRGRQGDQEFKASLSYMRPCLKENSTNERQTFVGRWTLGHM